MDGCQNSTKEISFTNLIALSYDKLL